MIRRSRLQSGLLASRLAREQRGAAFIMLLAFMALAVPLTIAALQVASQLSRNSLVNDRLLKGQYSAGAGMELALWQVLRDPNFDDGLTPETPSREITLEVNGQTVTLTVTKIFTNQAVSGQGLVVTKSVIPSTALASTPTTFTYTITLQNVGTGSVTVDRVYDFLPPRFSYVAGSTTGILTTSDPSVTSGAVMAVHYLNNAAAVPYPWNPVQGSSQNQASHTPAKGVWETVAQYWETVPFEVGGALPAATWQHTQWITSLGGGNKWRWRVQLVRGVTVTDLFVSADSGPLTTWSAQTNTYSAPAINIQAGDKLRLRLEVTSPQNDPANRRIDYRWGGGASYDSRTSVPQLAYSACAGILNKLTWALSSPVTIPAQETRVLTFNATATLPDGAYYNQAGARYTPWWNTTPLETYTPFTAKVTVGSGTPACGYNLYLQMDKTVDVSEPPPGVPVELTYAITLTNIAAGTSYVCDVNDLLPAGFDYVLGSTTGDITRDPHAVHWETGASRYRAHWRHDQWTENSGNYIFALGPAQTKTFSFRASGTPLAGLDYFNEVYGSVIPPGAGSVCAPGESYGNTEVTQQGGASGSAEVSSARIYDISAVAADGTILSRVIFWQSEGRIEILSWQEY